MTCEDVIGILDDYVDGALGPELTAALELHLRDCAPCVAYINTYRKTRHLAAEVGRVDPPEELTRRVREFVLRQMRGGQPG